MSFMNRLMGEEPGFIKKTLYWLKEGSDTGNYGEYLTEYALEHAGLPGSSHVFRNVLVPRKGGPTTESEVDVMLLHGTGIYVMESKNYEGWIFGSEDQPKWTQSLPGGKKYHFYNPIRQNRSHIRALAAFLELPEEAFRSYIVFSERCELKSVPASCDAFVICKRNRMLKTLRADVARRASVFDIEEVERLRTRIARMEDASTSESKAEHVRQARRVQAGEVCPLCGGELVRRKGRYGAFMGCANYPECHYTRKM